MIVKNEINLVELVLQVERLLDSPWEAINEEFLKDMSNVRYTPTFLSGFILMHFRSSSTMMLVGTSCPSFMMLATFSPISVPLMGLGSLEE